MLLFIILSILSLAIMGCAAVVYEPLGAQVDTLGQTALPVAMTLGKLGLVVVILGFFAATFGAALETGLSAGYTVAQYFGWQWGKLVRPRQAARFHTVVLISVLLGVALLLTTADLTRDEAFVIVRAVYLTGQDLLAAGSTQGAQVSIANARRGVTVPLHDGAQEGLAALEHGKPR